MVLWAPGEELFLIPGIDMLNHMTDDGVGSRPYVANAGMSLSTRVIPGAQDAAQEASCQCFVLTAGECPVMAVLLVDVHMSHGVCTQVAKGRCTCAMQLLDVS